MSDTLMQAHREWASRPADERFVSLDHMLDHFENIRARSRASVVTARSLSAQPVEDTKGLTILDQDGRPMAPTNWSFGQLAQRVQAPAAYLRTLPSPLAADLINFGLIKKGGDEIGVLSLMDESAMSQQLTAATGPAYGRVWNADVVEALIRRFGNGIDGDFRVPGEFGERVDVTKANTTLYAGDRNMFVFLADEEHKVEMPTRRIGRDGTAIPGMLSRGFFVWNSEHGDCTLGVGTFLFDYVCQNRMIWGAEGYREIKIRHTSGAPSRFVDEVAPALETFRKSSTTNIVEAVEAAQARKIEDDIEDFLAKRFTRTQTQAIIAAHLSEEDRPIETLWDAATGITAYAKSVAFQDERVDLERKAGAVLELAR